MPAIPTDLKRWRLILANAFALRTPALTTISRGPRSSASNSSMSHLHPHVGDVAADGVEQTRPRVRQTTPSSENKTTPKPSPSSLRESLFAEIKDNFNTELFEQPLLCDGLPIDNQAIAIVIGHGTAFAGSRPRSAASPTVRRSLRLPPPLQSRLQPDVARHHGHRL